MYFEQYTYIFAVQHRYRSNNHPICIDMLVRVHNCVCVKWSFFSQAGLEGIGKNPKSRFFLLGLRSPWGQVLSLKTFCRIRVLFLKISCANFQLTKFVSSLKDVSGNLFSAFWHLVVMFGQNEWFQAYFQNSIFQSFF